MRSIFEKGLNPWQKSEAMFLPPEAFGSQVSPDANELSEEAMEKMAQAKQVTERLQQLEAALKKPS